MKRLATLLGLIALVVAPPLFAAERLIGTIVAAASTTNASTAAPFKSAYPDTLAGLPLTVQSDVAVYYRACMTSACTATTSDTKIAAGALYDIDMASDDRFIAFLPVAGAATIHVYTRTVVRR